MVVVVVVFVLSRANELFCLSVRDGEVIVVRGRVPPALFHGIEEVVRRARVQSGTIRAVKSDGASRLVVGGIDDNVAQRLRNTFGTHPVSRFRAAPLPDARNLGQWLGWSWLAWLLIRR